MMDIIQQDKVSRIVEGDSDRKKSEENAQKFSKMLNCYLSREFEEKKSLTESVIGHTVNAHGDEYELYLRVTPPKGGIWDSDTLVIARIGFKEHRRGHGRNFMAFLVESAGSIGYSKIGLECTNDKSDAFGKRFGLQKHGVYNHLLGTVHTITNNLK
ncbi:MAG: hypothetical protein CFE47_01910 [Pseudomonas sp. PGPPP1]|uniref:hypothetical protein n=1 Tax=Pseudomonas sp. PGPPP1 TaxID=2015553 RepID=UPI000BC6E2AC|nr:hypothetical protein [Pseudomonas sp. PGPPP1]OYU09129.1 MAG: hypothetical protein CFE47_01910 [Pseudomonas sp. PGPPP1]